MEDRSGKLWFGTDRTPEAIAADVYQLCGGRYKAIGCIEKSTQDIVLQVCYIVLHQIKQLL